LTFERTSSWSKLELFVVCAGEQCLESGHLAESSTFVNAELFKALPASQTTLKSNECFFSFHCPSATTDLKTWWKDGECLETSEQSQSVVQETPLSRHRNQQFCPTPRVSVLQQATALKLCNCEILHQKWRGLWFCAAVILLSAVKSFFAAALAVALTSVLLLLCSVLAVSLHKFHTGNPMCCHFSITNIVKSSELVAFCETGGRKGPIGNTNDKSERNLDASDIPKRVKICPAHSETRMFRRNANVRRLRIGARFREGKTHWLEIPVTNRERSSLDKREDQ
jgi:hypothetical protein